MARTKEFDPDAAVASAIELFWDHGYANSSVQDVVDRLGLNRGSLYATFGSKHDLFIAALTRYCQEAPTPLIEALDGDGPVVPALRGALLDVVDFDLSAPKRRGCLLLNSAMECLPGDPAVTALFERTTAAVKAAFESTLRRGQLDGDISTDIAPRDGAAFLLTTLQGIRVLSKSGASRAELESTIDLALAALT